MKQIELPQALRKALSDSFICGSPLMVNHKFDDTGKVRV